MADFDALRPLSTSHHHTASPALLGSIRIVLLLHRAPDRWYHEVLCAVRVRDDAVGCGLVFMSCHCLVLT